MSRMNESPPSTQQGRILNCVSREAECALFYYSCLFGLCGTAGAGVEMCCPDPLPKECANFMLFGLLADLAVLVTTNITFAKNAGTFINKQPTAETEPLHLPLLPETGRLLTCASRQTENSLLYYCCLTAIFGGLMTGAVTCCPSLPIPTAAYYCLLSGCDTTCATCLTTNIKTFSECATIWKSSLSAQDPSINSVNDDAPSPPEASAPITRQPPASGSSQPQHPHPTSHLPRRVTSNPHERTTLLEPPPPYTPYNTARH